MDIVVGPFTRKLRDLWKDKCYVEYLQIEEAFSQELPEEEDLFLSEGPPFRILLVQLAGFRQCILDLYPFNGISWPDFQGVMQTEGYFIESCDNNSCIFQRCVGKGDSNSYLSSTRSIALVESHLKTSNPSIDAKGSSIEEYRDKRRLCDRDSVVTTRLRLAKHEIVSQGFEEDEETQSTWKTTENAATSKNKKNKKQKIQTQMQMEDVPDDRREHLARRLEVRMDEARGEEDKLRKELNEIKVYCTYIEKELQEVLDTIELVYGPDIKHACLGAVGDLRAKKGREDDSGVSKSRETNLELLRRVACELVRID
jgi:hypothetical protein